MADIILIQPKIGEWDYIKTHPSLPLSLLHAATLTDKEYQIKLIDQRTDKQWEKQLVNELRKQPILAGTTSMTGIQIKHALRASKIIKQASDTPVVWGGVHPSLLPAQTLRNDDIDIVIQGEGEITLYELVKALEHNKTPEGIKGVWYKENGKIKNNPEREFIDLNKLPEIPYHLIDVCKYMPKSKGRSTIYMQTSRGCPFQCTYCYNNILNKRKWRALNPEKTIKRIKTAVEDFGAENIYFVDDNLFIDLNRAKTIFESIIEEKLNITWEAQGVRIATVLQMSEKYLAMLEKSGCMQLRMGAESGSARILDLIEKGITPQQSIEVNQKLKPFNIIAHFDFLCGFPSETMEELRETTKLIMTLLDGNPNARISPVHCYTPQPGTELFDYAVKNGFKPPENLEGWIDYGSNTTHIHRNRKEIFESLHLVSMFLDTKSRELVGSKVVKLFAELYRPVARWRVKNFSFKFMIETKLREVLLKLYERNVLQMPGNR